MKLRSAFVLLGLALGSSYGGESMPDKMLGWGETQLNAGNADLALTVFDHYLSQYPPTVRAYLDRGDARRRLDKPADAIDDYNRAMALDPNSAHAYHGRANARMDQHDYKGAVADYSKTIELSPGDANAWVSRGGAKSELGDSQALEDIDHGLKLSPDSPLGLYNRAVVKWRSGDLKGAAEDVEHALKSDSRWAQAYRLSGQIQMATRHTVEALAAYNQAVRYEPRLALNYLERGYAEASSGAYSAANDDAKRALDLDPKCAGAYALYAEVKRINQDLDGAIADCTHALQFDAACVPAYVSRGRAEAMKGDYALAEADFSKVIELDPRNAEAFDFRGRVKLLENQTASAHQDFDRALNLDPTRAAGYKYEGWGRYASDGSYWARLAPRLAQELPGFGDAPLFGPAPASKSGKPVQDRIGQALEKIRDESSQRAAMSVAAEATAATPEPEVLLKRAAAEFMKRDLGAALADVNRVLEQEPNDVPALAQRAAIKQSDEDDAGAITDANHALELEPKAARIYVTRAEAEARLNDMTGAEADLEHALELHPGDAFAYRIRAQLELALGRYDAALADAAQSLASNPQNPSPTLIEGDVLAAQGQWQEAVAKWHEYVNAGPKRPEYVSLYLWVAQTRLGQKEAADRELSDFLAQRWQSGPQDWAVQLAEYLLGRETEEDLFVAAASNNPNADRRRHCEAWYFAGMKRLFAQQRPQAREFFQRSIATGAKINAEYVFAQSELRALTEVATPARDSFDVSR